MTNRCGLCVHRNCGDTYKRGFCSPKGWRDRDQEPCDHFHPRDQPDEQRRLAKARLKLLDTVPLEDLM